MFSVVYKNLESLILSCCNKTRGHFCCSNPKQNVFYVTLITIRTVLLANLINNKNEHDCFCTSLFALEEVDEEPLQRWRLLPNLPLFSGTPHETAYVSLRALIYSFSSSDTGAMHCTDTAETFSIRSTQESVPQFSTEGTCATTKPEQFLKKRYVDFEK